MKSKKCEEDARRIVGFFQRPENDRRATIDHFLQEGLNAKTIARVINRFEKTGQIGYSKKSGPRPTILTSSALRKVGNHYKRNPEISERILAAKLRMSKGSVYRSKKKLKIRSRKKKTAPKFVKDQKERAEKNARRLYKISIPSGGDKFFIMDDETYCPIDPSQVPGSEFYSQVGDEEVDLEFKLKRKTKFAAKYLVWQAIAENGEVSEPFITTGTINQQVYLEECIKKRLVPFIEKFEDKNVLFWPDLASVHYATAVQQYLKSQNIDFVSKEQNPPSVPDLRPIET